MQTIIRMGFGLGLACTMLTLLVRDGSTTVHAQTGKKTLIVAPKSPNTEVKLGVAEVKMDAGEWYAEFNENFKGARDKYTGKVIELTGTATELSEHYGNARIRMATSTVGKTFDCYTVDRRPWLKVSPGAKIKVKGIVPQAGSVGDLGSVQIVDAGKYEALTLTAAQLAGDYAKERKDAVIKYDTKWCNLSGEVIESKDTPSGRQVTLKAEGGIAVICVSGTFGKTDPMATLKKGTKAKLFGQLVVKDNDEKKVYLINGLLSEPRTGK